MNELTVQKRAPEVIVAEIWTLNRSQLVNWIETGRKLCELKESVPYGEFGKWVKEAGYSTTKANNLMRLYTEFGAAQGNLFGTDVEDFQTYGKLQYSQAVALLEVPAEERAEFMETHDVEDMSVRELQKVIRERDEAKKAAADFEEDNKELAAKLRQKEARVKELEAAPKEVYRDEEAIKAAAYDARAAAEAEWKNKVSAANDMARNAENMAKDIADKLKAAEDKLAKAEEKAKKAAEKTKTAGEDASKKNAAELEAAKKAEADAKAEAEQLRAELDAAKREQAKALISGDADLALVQEYGGQIAQFVNKLGGMLKKARNNGNEKTAELVRKALADLAEQIGGLAK